MASIRSSALKAGCSDMIAAIYIISTRCADVADICSAFIGCGKAASSGERQKIGPRAIAPAASFSAPLSPPGEEVFPLSASPLCRFGRPAFGVAHSHRRRGGQSGKAVRRKAGKPPLQAAKAGRKTRRQVRSLSDQLFAARRFAAANKRAANIGDIGTPGRDYGNGGNHV
ncbi:hypothetical protein HPB50_014921 [Hyalomma asiaticum]|uniref:Uncharacterized protein n=1 Tax=Hyalomma asiaticum TaxID=266040 RepID=A0ACB7TDY2_HYAAI|nr:hypothetical protein HPB50_014921 [Hyalomma asiaticum]